VTVSHNHAVLFDAIATAMPDEPCIVFRDRCLTYGQVLERVNRFANFLVDHGLTIHRPRTGLADWESGQDHIGPYLYNGNEYLEATLGANAARAVGFNVNYRYVEAELAYLLNDARASALVYHAAFAPTLAAVLPRLSVAPLLVQVADESGNELLPGAVDCEEALAASSPATPATEPDPSDLYILYTGGTTGMPKGTLWTQGDLFSTALAVYLPQSVADSSSLPAIVDAVVSAPRVAVMPLPPLMHGAAHWLALGALVAAGAVVVVPNIVERFDARDALTTMARERVAVVTFVGDAFGRPLCDEIERSDYDLSAMTVIISGGAVLSPGVTSRLLLAVPTAMIIDAAGASESGAQLTNISVAGEQTSSGIFTPSADTRILDETMSDLVVSGHDVPGWLGRAGAIPLGYLGDPAKTERTFRVIAGERVVILGDRVRLRADGLVELLGRDSVTINSGGEKIFAEEVEQALIAHPSIDDALVVGRPSQRWGQEVVAVVQIADGADVGDDELLTSAAEHIARYKLPKAIVRVDAVRRSPSGKADYAWARAAATGGGTLVTDNDVRGPISAG
jgi:3-oxocholest-4-en-26-oate---CoA ligase